MPRNVEIKARLTDPDRVRALAARLGDGPPQVIHQRDAFYLTRAGRLKLREFGDGRGELIAYERANVPGPKTSRYAIAPTSDSAALHAALAAALGVRAVVIKERTLVMRGRTRIHLDRVAGLGDFLELEVVLAEGEPEAAGRREAEDLLGRLGLTPGDLVDRAYVDLLEEAP